MRHDPKEARKLASRLRSAQATYDDQIMASGFVEAWCDQWEFEQLEQAGQLRLIG